MTEKTHDRLLRASNSGKVIEVRKDIYGHEVGIVAGDTAIYVRRCDLPRLIGLLEAEMERPASMCAHCRSFADPCACEDGARHDKGGE